MLVLGRRRLALGAGGRLLGRRVARRERLRERAVLVDHAEGVERLVERLLRTAEWYAVLRAPRAGERRLDRGEGELHDLRVLGRGGGLVPERILLAVRLDERDPLARPARHAQVLERQLVDG